MNEWVRASDAHDTTGARGQAFTQHCQQHSVVDRCFEGNIIKTLYCIISTHLLNLPTMHLHRYDVPADVCQSAGWSAGCSGVTHDTAVTILLVSGCNLTVIVSVASVVTVARDR